MSVVAEAELVFDLLVRERELPAALDLVMRYPQIRFVLDHIAKPPIASGAVPLAWSDGIARLAARPNVWCKLSGLVTEADPSGWTLDDLRPYVAHVVRAFGPDRLMFGSDWPVCLLAASYARVVDAADRLLTDLVPSAADREAVFGRTAAGVYRV